MKKIFIISIMLTLSMGSCVVSSQMSNIVEERISIHDIQGCTHVSPFDGMSITDVEGIVTWKVSNGFFIQEQIPDLLDCSSEAIFVFTHGYPSVIPGDLVSVGGRVEEYTPGDASDGNLSVTEISAEEVTIIGEGFASPPPTIIGSSGRVPPDQYIEDDGFLDFDEVNDGLDFYESLEGMLVQLEDARVVESTNSYNEIFVIPAILEDENILSSSGALVQSETDSNPERILIQLPDGFKKSVYMGQVQSSRIVGVISYEYGNYRILAMNSPEFEHGEPIEVMSLKKLSYGEIRLATYNINNFTRYNDEKLNQLAEQIVNNLLLPDILVLQEVQDDTGADDDGTTSAAGNLYALVKSIEDMSSIAYQYIDNPPHNNTSGGAPGANIRTAIIFRSDRGLILEEADIAIQLADPLAFNGSREPLICHFSINRQDLYIVGIHFVSNNLNSPLFGRIQPIERPEEDKRLKQAEAVVNIVKAIQEEGDDPYILVAGDFNDTPWSKTLMEFTETKMMNTTQLVNNREAYSIIYEGNASLFDQILVSDNLFGQITNEAILHINTRFPEEKQISDHDPVVVDFTP